jgi:hypothetical protein
MRKLYEIFKILQIQKIIVSAETILFAEMWYLLHNIMVQNGKRLVIQVTPPRTARISGLKS